MDTRNSKGRGGFWEAYRACVDANEPHGQIIENHQPFFS
jgi:hypothetical protein